MGEAGRERVVPRYAVERLVDDIDALYRELLSEPGLRAAAICMNARERRLLLAARRSAGPDCQPASVGSSRSRNQSIMSMRGFLRAIANACVRYAACFA